MFGVPQFILSDNARAYMGRLMVELLNKYEVEHITSPCRHPQANPAERYVKTVATSIRCLLEEQSLEHRNWDQFLSQIQLALNSLVHSSTKISPYKMLFGRESSLMGSEYQQASAGGAGHSARGEKLALLRQKAREALEKAQRKSKEDYDKETAPLKFYVGEKVWKKNFELSAAASGFSQKLAKKYVPAHITEVVGHDTYMVQEENGHRAAKFHANELLKDRTSADEDDNEEQ